MMEKNSQCCLTAKDCENNNQKPHRVENNKIKPDDEVYTPPRNNRVVLMLRRLERGAYVVVTFV